MSRRSSMIEDILRAPWWISLIILVIGNIFIRVMLPMWFEGNRATGPIGALMPGAINQAIPTLATMFSLVFGFTLLTTGGRDLIRWLKDRPKEPAIKETPMYQMVKTEDNHYAQKTIYRSTSSDVKICPECSSDMKIKTKQSGSDKGVEFWVCSQFPECKAYEVWKEEKWF